MMVVVCWPVLPADCNRHHATTALPCQRCNSHSCYASQRQPERRFAINYGVRPRAIGTAAACQAFDAAHAIGNPWMVPQLNCIAKFAA